MKRNYVMRSRMYRARRVAGGGCLVLSPATTNAGGCVSRSARVPLHEEFQRRGGGSWCRASIAEWVCNNLSVESGVK